MTPPMMDKNVRLHKEIKIQILESANRQTTSKTRIKKEETKTKNNENKRKCNRTRDNEMTKRLKFIILRVLISQT